MAQQQSITQVEVRRTITRDEQKMMRLLIRKFLFAVADNRRFMSRTNQQPSQLKKLEA